MINPTAVAQLVLAKVASLDPRTPKPNQATLDAWAEHLTGIRPDEALAAVTEHYRTSTTLIMPADLLRHIRAARQDAASRAVIAALPPSTRPLMPAAIERSALALAPAHQSATCVPCPWCHAQTGSPCTQPSRGGPKARSTPHPARIEAARKADAA